ncbi:MAG: glycosyltransferase family 39 protein [Ardenticatenaceae bacterium]|nr:glycosyltransferase family 39 protein [Ardenticatenaceae bacterium]MCB9444798.1 glycosyltransferase family 39 protein [Ardenticatenaceae bacterium]
MSEEIGFEEAVPWLVTFITLIGGGLRILLLGMKGMWLDETFSVWLANHNVGEMLQWIVKIDQHPPLYYLLLHYWIALNGDTPYYVRLLSALFGAGTIPVIYLIGKRLSGMVTGLAAAVILALSPFHIYFAQETRMYTLLTFNTAVAIYALVRLLTDSRAVRPIGGQFREYLHAWRTLGPVEPETPKEFSYKDVARNQSRWRAWTLRHRWLSIQAIETDLAWVVFILFSAAALLSHNTAVLFPLATNIFVIGLMVFQRKKEPVSLPVFQAPSLGNWVKAQIGIFLLWSPWLLAFVQQAGRVYQRFWIPEPTWDNVIKVLGSFLNASAPLPVSLTRLIWSLYGLVFCLGLVYYRKKVSQFIFLFTLFAIPFLGELIVSIRRPIFYDRTLIWLTIPLFLVLAAGVAQFRFRILIAVVLGSLGTINLFSAGDYYRFYQKEDWYTAAGYVALFAEKDDLILFNSNFVEIPFDYYFKPFEKQYAIQVEKQGVPKDLFDSGILEPQMTESDIPGLTSLTSGHDRVWLVYSHDSYTDPMGLIPETLAAQMQLIQERDFYGGQVQLYATP